MANFRRPLATLGLVVTSNFTAYTMVLTLVPLYSLELGASASLVGLLTAAIAFFPLFFAVRVGSIVDRLGAKQVLIAASLVLAASPLLVLIRPGIPALFATQIGLGFANLLAVVAGQAYTASVGNGRQHEGNFGWYTTFVSAGQVIGPILAGFGIDSIGFLATFAATAGLALIAVGSSLGLPARSSGRMEEEAGSQTALEFRRARQLMGIAVVQFAMIVTFVVAFAQSAFTAFFPLILENAGFTATWIGAMLSLRAVVSMVLRPLLPWAVLILGNRERALKLMLLLVAISFVALGTSQAIVVVVLVSVITGLWWGLCPPLSIVMIVDAAPTLQQGFALGLRLTANRLAQFIGPLAIGFVADLISLRMGFYACGSLMGLSLSLLIQRGRRETASGAERPLE